MRNKYAMQAGAIKQRIYGLGVNPFVDAAESLFCPNVLALAIVFAALGAIFLLRLTLPDAVTAFAGVQALWWLAAAVALIARSRKISGIPVVSHVR